MADYLPVSKVEEINISAVLDRFVYMDAQSIDFHNKTLREISLIIDPAGEGFLAQAINSNSYIGDIKLVSQSSIDGEISLQHLVACAFETPDNKLYVAYRGTGDGKWVDNGDALANESSFMQRKAEEYFDNVIASNGYENYAGRIIVTGHSKGGNSAQYVMLSSMYGHLIDACYSLDGQGFSKQAVEAFIAKYGYEYYMAQLGKTYSINGENDYVHELGIVVIPKENTFYVETPNANDFAGWHELSQMMNGAEINWKCDDKGNVVSVEQGPIGKFAKDISKEMMALSQKDLDDCAVTLMSLLEMFLPGAGGLGEYHKYGTGDRKFATLEEFCTFVSVGIPLIIKSGLASDEIKKMIGDSIREFISGIANSKNGGWKVAGLTILTVMAAPVAISLAASIWTVATAVHILSDIADGVVKVVNNVKSFCAKVKNAVVNFGNNLKNWFNSNFNAGFKAATSNPDILVDTQKMRDYASRITKVNSRLSSVDKRMDALYGKLINIWDIFGSAKDIYNLLKADLSTGHSARLKRCASYLNDTANGFETAERNILSKAITN